jgi:hypothetical protein
VYLILVAAVLADQLLDYLVALDLGLVRKANQLLVGVPQVELLKEVHEVKADGDFSLLSELVLSIFPLRKHFLLQTLLDVGTSVLLILESKQSLDGREYLHSDFIGLGVLVELVQEADYVLGGHFL